MVCRRNYCIVKVSPAVMEELKRIVLNSEILNEDDSQWPEPNKNGLQELEILVNNTHIFYTVIVFL